MTDYSYWFINKAKTISEIKKKNKCSLVKEVDEPKTCFTAKQRK